MEVEIQDIPVLYVESANGPAGSGEAFNLLERPLPTLRGRKFYGTFMHPNGPYRACVVRTEADSPEAMGLSTWVIPGGKYAQRKMENWTEHPWDIPNEFGSLSEAYAGRIDATRPSIEFYRSQKELVLLLPIR